MASRVYRACALCQSSVPLRVIYKGLSGVAQPHARVDFLKGTPHRKHPGRLNMKTLRLPEELQRGALSIIHDVEVKGLADRAHSLTNFLWSRKRAPEDASMRKAAMALEKSLWEKAQMKHGDVDSQLLEAQIKKKVFSELRKRTYHWTPLKYDEDLGVVYMAARLAGGYAAVLRALNEIKKRDLSFTPTSLLDFGSGLGTVLWASHTLWGDTLKEMVLVDSSGAMNSLADRLIRGGTEKDPPFIQHVYFRQFLPVTPKVQFDLVVGAFSLSELGSQKEREETVLTLWRKTGSYLVLVENGTKEGHQILMSAREAILTRQDKVTHDPRRPCVFAPCPHEYRCPKLANLPWTPCNYPQRYWPLPVTVSPQHLTETFSYLVMSRAHALDRPTDVRGGSAAEGLDWARLTAPVLRRPRHVHCQVCCSSGELKRIVVTDRQNGRDMYRCARMSDWGDLLPVVQSEEEGLNSSDSASNKTLQDTDT